MKNIARLRGFVLAMTRLVESHGSDEPRLLDEGATLLRDLVENLTASRSRIVDTDFASETATLSRNQVLQQAGTAMLAQANAMPQSVLALLRG